MRKREGLKSLDLVHDLDKCNCLAEDPKIIDENQNYCNRVRSTLGLKDRIEGMQVEEVRSNDTAEVVNEQKRNESEEDTPMDM